jgi:predicted N-acetyltransferase YhbS
MIEIFEDRIDFEAVHSMLANSYWSPGVSREVVERAAAGSSLVLSAFDGELQVGYLRVISDRATFGYLCDVIVHEDFRGKGIGRDLVRAALSHPDHQGFRRWVLATLDAHGVYTPFGFGALEEPERWMIFRPNPVADSPCI